MKKYLFIFILLLAIFFRFFWLNSIPPAIYVDEAYNALDAARANDSGNYQLFYPENDGREGLFINLQAMVWRVFPAGEPWTLRLPSAVLGVLTVLGLWLLVKILFADRQFFRKVADWSALFLATSVWHITFSRIGFRAIMAPFFLVWSLYFLLLVWQNKSRWRFVFLFLVGLFYGLGFHTYIAYRVTPLLILAVFIWHYLDSRCLIRRVKEGLVFLAGSIVSIFPLVFYFLHHPESFFDRIDQLLIFSQPNWAWLLLKNFLFFIGQFFIMGDANARHNFSYLPALSAFAILGIVFLLLVLRDKKVGKLVGHHFWWLALAWFVVGALPAIFSFEGNPHFLRSIMVLPLMMIMPALGIALVDDLYLSSAVFPVLARKIFLVVGILLLIIQAGVQYFVLYGGSVFTKNAFNYQCLEFADTIKSLPPREKKYIQVEPYPSKPGLVSGCFFETMFYTNSFTTQNQQAQNIYYFVGNQNPPDTRDGHLFILNFFAK